MYEPGKIQTNKITYSVVEIVPGKKNVLWNENLKTNEKLPAVDMWKHRSYKANRNFVANYSFIHAIDNCQLQTDKIAID